ncbi:hypothetical protein [Amycolatopsis pigmentata]|uniref:Uncharacterized protein n=1 Tax=Amycolatopsis pigmentata TaxID=450801 RepID=A0ABW5FR41_9PSEU
MRVRKHQDRYEERSAPRPTPSPAMGGTAADRVAMLQRTVGNAAVSAALAVQRSDGDPVVPEIGEENGPSATSTDLSALNPRERGLSTKYGIRIGPAPGPDVRHFSDKLLDRIDAALAQLPTIDVRTNDELLAIELDTNPEGSATLYHGTTQSVGVVKPVLAGGVRAPQFLYAMLNTDIDWQRRKMDKALLAEYGVEQAGNRTIFGQQGNLVKWTVRHEVGHAVDQKVGWEENLAAEVRFGGWQSYGLTTEIQVAGAILAKAGLTGVTFTGHQTAAESLAPLLRPGEVAQRLDDGTFDRFLRRFNPAPTPAQRQRVLGFLRTAISVPWTFPDGGATALEVNGRVYHIDQYDTWVSYLRAQRAAYKISNYQYSSPKEWFAEAYSAYFNTKKPGLRQQINPQALEWFHEHETNTRSSGA